MQKRFNPLKPDAPTPRAKPEALKRGTILHPAPVGPAPVLTENDERDGLELRFPQRPGPAVLEFFHSTKDLPAEQRWHFHFKGKYWYAKRNEATRKFEEMLIAHANSKTPVAPCPAPSAVFAPAIVPSPLEARWHAETEQGLTKLPFDLWSEQVAAIAGDTHPAPVERSPRIIPVRFRPDSWRRRPWSPPVTVHGNGGPA